MNDEEQNTMDDLGELYQHKPTPEEENLAERMMEIHREIAEEWQGPPLTAEQVDDWINEGQR